MPEVEKTHLLQSIAEQLRVPLTVIARQAEASQLVSTPSFNTAELIKSQANAALALVDNYLLGLQLLAGQGELALTPVSVASTLVDVAHILQDFARQYDVGIDLAIAGRYEPVMAHGQALRAALVSLGFALVEAVSASQRTSHRRLLLAVHRTRGGIVAGLYGQLQLSSVDWRRARSLEGTAHQPLQSMLSSSAAGLFVADALGQAMAAPLQVGRHARNTGLAMTLLPSQQLRFV